jgi:hypothetical protein
MSQEELEYCRAQFLEEQREISKRLAQLALAKAESVHLKLRLIKRLKKFFRKS